MCVFTCMFCMIGRWPYYLNKANVLDISKLKKKTHTHTNSVF